MKQYKSVRYLRCSDALAVKLGAKPVGPDQVEYTMDPEGGKKARVKLVGAGRVIEMVYSWEGTFYVWDFIPDEAKTEGADKWHAKL